jgi:hypothetical protein
MLHARSDAAEREAGDERENSTTPSGKQISNRRHRRAEREPGALAEPFREQAGHDTGIGDLEKADLGDAQAQLRLPRRKEYIEQINVAIMRHMRAASRGKHASAGADLEWRGCRSDFG